MENIIKDLENLKEKDFLTEIQKSKTPSLAIAYFASMERGQGNVIKRWYAKAELMQREHQNLKSHVNIAKWSAIFSAVSSFCALISVIITFFVK